MDSRTPTFLDIEAIFYKIYLFFRGKFSLGRKETDFGEVIQVGGEATETFATSGGSDAGSIFVFIVSIVSVIVISFIVYSLVRIQEIRQAERRKIHDNLFVEPMDTKSDTRWHKVLDLIRSDNPGDWRLAIMEADTMLEEMTLELGLVGDTLGERLKNANVNTFKNLQNAWEAHKIRNRIAHEGLNYELPYRQAKRAIDLFEMTFVEFNYL